MRRVGIMDLHHAARAVAAAPPGERAALARALCIRAHWADKYVKRLRRFDRIGGDGSLRAASVGLPKVAQGPVRGDLADGYRHVIQALTDREWAKSSDEAC